MSGILGRWDDEVSSNSWKIDRLSPDTDSLRFSAWILLYVYGWKPFMCASKISERIGCAATSFAKIRKMIFHLQLLLSV